MNYTRFQKRKFLVTSFPKKEIYFREKISKLDYTIFHKRKFRITAFPKKEFYSLEKLLKLFHKRKFLVTRFPKKEIFVLGNFENYQNQITRNSIKGNLRLLTS